MSSKSLLGWNCRQCSFYHQAPNARCVMCGELRNATRQEMRNFVKGKPIPPTIEGNIVELLSPEEESEKQEEQKPEVAKTAKNDNSQNQDSNMQPPNYFAPNASKSVVRNPYDSRSTAASNVGTNKGQTDKPSSASSKPATSTSTVPSNHRQPLHSITAPPPKIATVFQRPPLRPKEMNLNSNNNRKGKTQRSRFSFIPKESQSYTPGPAPIHPETSTTWIYPQHKDFPIRQYQLEMSETAINYNTIVSLPTGLGKTLIAAVVLYNYYRWFPTGKLIFMAPTLPLVSQQAEACFDIMGIPEADTAILTGKIKAASRIELWKSRRVFFCTPQTVQKDLLSEESSSFASKVVCVVLDEAHKASGDYAYTKVISLLETASARFRIVGLSATPGTTIKAIQRVVDALRTVKIEARDENDPTVAPYLHQKRFEIVVVEKNDSQKEVERILTQMLGPVLERLRLEGALRVFAGIATLTTFQIHKSREEYTKRGNTLNGPIFGYFQAAYKLVELRNDAHQSLGCVKTKILRLRSTPQRGILSTIVKSTDFQNLYQKVMDATGSESDSESILGRNNPKLKKIAELLTEHFERAKATGKSSRAIVFSQFRDSVSEIVELLKNFKPMIRARHFVGQQGSKSSSSAGEGDKRLGGMKQAEQHQVIKLFREDVFNVLICTSIGEEGLDIGQVDLIVNYDTLRSPIRMIQRTGRTGRKRDGRVVCLISEGQEERKYIASKQAEKTLNRALKNPKGFIMAPHQLLLPIKPVRQVVSIQVNSKFRMSQVGQPQTKASRKSKIATKWRLDSFQEEERYQRLGDILILNEDWREFRRILLKGRVSQGAKGRTVKILQSMERFGTTVIRKSRRRRAGGAISSLFPLDQPTAEDEDMFVSNRQKICPSLFSKDVPGQIMEDGTVSNPCTKSVRHPRKPNQNEETLEVSSSETNIAQVKSFPAQHCEDNPKNIDSTERGDANSISDMLKKSNEIQIKLPEASNKSFKAPSGRGIFGNVSSITVQPISSEHKDARDPVISTTNASRPDGVAEMETIFRLPTPPSSSDEEDSNDDNSVKTAEEKAVSALAPGNNINLNRPSNTATTELSYRLPKQDEEANDDDNPAKSSGEKAISAPVPANNINVNQPPNPVTNELCFRPSTQDEEDSDENNSVKSMGEKDPSALVPDTNANVNESSGTATIDFCFRLPTQDEEDSDDESSTKVIEQNIGSVPVRVPDNNVNLNMSFNTSSTELHFRLPTQDSSSEDEDGEEEGLTEKNEATLPSPVIHAQFLSPKKFKKSMIGPVQEVNVEDARLQELFKLPSISKDEQKVAMECDTGSDSEPDIPLLSLKRPDTPLISLKKPVTPLLSLKKKKTDRKKRHIAESPYTDIGGSEIHLDFSSMTEQEDSSKGSEGVRFQNSVKQIATESSSFKTQVIGKKKKQKRILDDDEDVEASWMIGSLQGTPDYNISPHTKEKIKVGAYGSLTDTPVEPSQKKKSELCVSSGMNPDLVRCSVCFSGDSPDSNPLILCDGECNNVFHVSCYAINADINSDRPWFCDECSIQDSRDEMKCQLCSGHDRPLRKATSGEGWCHPLCDLFLGEGSESLCLGCSRKGAVRCFSCPKSVHPHCAVTKASLGLWTIASVGSRSAGRGQDCAIFCPDHTDKVDHFLSLQMETRGENVHCIKVIQTFQPSILKERSTKRIRNKGTSSRTDSGYVNLQGTIDGNSPSTTDCDSRQVLLDKKKEKLERLNRRRAVSLKFIEEEANIGSDEDIEGDEEEEVEARRREEEEMSQDSFINDSLTLTLHFSQDELRNIDPEASTDIGFHHHQNLDNERHLENQFKTPVLNRRMRKRDDQDPATTSSQKGLGNMHFIRSVLEHHRQGGDADEIEVAYNKLAKEESEMTSDSPAQLSAPVALAPQKIIINCPSSDDEFIDCKKYSVKETSILTAEQKQMVEQKRLAALERRRKLQG